MNPWAIPPFLSMTFIGSMGWLVYIRNPKSKTHQSFAYFCLSMVVWLLGFTMMYALGNTESALWWARLGFCGVSFMPPTVFHFLLDFLDQWHNRKWKLIVQFAYFSAVLGVFLSITNLVYKGLWTGGFWGVYPIAGILYPIFPITFITCFNLGALFLYLRLRKEEDWLRQQQIKYVLLAYAFASPGLIDYLIKIFQINVYPYGHICGAAWVFWMTVAIVKTQLLDIRILITRTGLFIAIYLVVLGVPVAVSAVGKEWFVSLLGDNWWLAPVGISTVLASLSPFVFTNLRKRTEEILLQKLAEKEREASIDDLTGLLARRAFLDKAGATLQMAKQAHQPCSLLMIDLDHFKNKNDTYGHLIGDMILMETAHRLTSAFRIGDLIGRYGGEEFIILLPLTNHAYALEIAQRLRETVAAKPVRTDAGQEIIQTLSIGLVTKNGETDIQDLIAEADQALYTAKNAGRNRVEVAAS